MSTDEPTREEIEAAARRRGIASRWMFTTSEALGSDHGQYEAMVDDLARAALIAAREVRGDAAEISNLRQKLTELRQEHARDKRSLRLAEAERNALRKEVAKARVEVEIDGSYGSPEGSIYLLDADGNEIVMWDSSEWIEDPSLVFVIANAIANGERKDTKGD